MFWIEIIVLMLRYLWWRPFRESFLTKIAFVSFYFNALRFESRPRWTNFRAQDAFINSPENQRHNNMGSLYPFHRAWIGFSKWCRLDSAFGYKSAYQRLSPYNLWLTRQLLSWRSVKMSLHRRFIWLERLFYEFCRFN